RHFERDEAVAPVALAARLCELAVGNMTSDHHLAPRGMFHRLPAELVHDLNGDRRQRRVRPIRRGEAARDSLLHRAHQGKGRAREIALDMRGGRGQNTRDDLAAEAHAQDAFSPERCTTAKYLPNSLFITSLPCFCISIPTPRTISSMPMRLPRAAA